ncbi:MAG: hypothetical protein KIC54_01320 [Clostridium sp.]|nr:hypothetical protein [Clostridium sp.]
MDNIFIFILRFNIAVTLTLLFVTIYFYFKSILNKGFKTKVISKRKAKDCLYVTTISTVIFFVMLFAFVLFIMP